MYNDDDKICIDFGDPFNSQDVKITHNGKNVVGVMKIEIVVEPDDIIRTRLTLCPVTLSGLKTVAKVFLIDPKDGKLKEVESITFKNENS